ncbi:MAG TPA: hypothetical protein VHE81_09080, partial [Lacipirellulaceae bacterium]|nr:hypothetical protein [Lacipirellulaceae bacterium]
MREPVPDCSASGYERPNEPWICGLMRHGESCAAGPTARGRCPALAECMPVRNGDRWECNRSTVRGGPCAIGPTPEGGCGRVLQCRPVRSLRAVRGRFVRGCALLAIGAVIILLSANWRDRVIAPGRLAQQHAQLLERTDGDPNCAACHAAANQNIAGWMVSLVVSRGDEPSQSHLCMKCHAKSISPAMALTAHNVAPNKLRQIEATRTTALPHTRTNEVWVACAACHGEHHGTHTDLTSVDNVACQTCHVQRYESFAADHRDFGIWPYERRTRIVFNHASHRDKHFADKKKSFDCQSCHKQDATGSVELVAGYEAACSECHDEKIATSVAPGVPMFALPTIDVAALRSAGFDVGTWPKGATGDFDGRLPPAMKLLLAADPAAAQAIATLGADFDFQDVHPEDRQQLAACATLASAIKKLVGELAASSNVTVQDRLREALGRPISQAEVTLLVTGLSRDTLRRAAESWAMGSIKDSSNASQTLSARQTDPQIDRNERPVAFAPAGTWFRDSASFSIRYRPSAHADPVLAAWLNVLAETPHLDQRPIASAMLKELSKQTAPGLCVSCHSIEQSGSGGL